MLEVLSGHFDTWYRFKNGFDQAFVSFATVCVNLWNTLLKL